MRDTRGSVPVPSFTLDLYKLGRRVTFRSELKAGRELPAECPSQVSRQEPSSQTMYL